MSKCKYCGRYRDPGDRCGCGEKYVQSSSYRGGGKRKPAPVKIATPEEMLHRCISYFGEEGGREYWETLYR